MPPEMQRTASQVSLFKALFVNPLSEHAIGHTSHRKFTFICMIACFGLALRSLPSPSGLRPPLASYLTLCGTTMTSIQDYHSILTRSTK